MLRALTITASLTCLLAAVGPADAAEEWSPAKTVAVGGAGRVMPLDNAGITLNPAAMITPMPAYSMEVGYQRFDALRGNMLHMSAMDSQTSQLAMGISQSFLWSNPPFVPAQDMAWYDGSAPIEDEKRFDRFSLALAYGFAQRRFNIGTALRVYHREDPLRGNRTPVSLDVGLSWWISPNVAIGVVGGNLVPTHLEEEPRTLAAGFGTILAGGLLWLEIDGILDFDSGDKVLVDTNAGAQVTVFRQFNIRAGFASDHGFRDKYVSWGLGWTIPAFSASYTMRVEVGEMDRDLNPDRSAGANRMVHLWMLTLAFP